MYIELNSFIGIVLILCIGALIGSLTTVFLSLDSKCAISRELKEDSNINGKIICGDKEVSPKELVEITNSLTKERSVMINQFYLLNLCTHCKHYDSKTDNCSKKIKKYMEDGSERFCEAWTFTSDNM